MGEAARVRHIGALLQPARQRFFSRFLLLIDVQLEQMIAVIHHLDAARSDPIGLEGFGFLLEVARGIVPPSLVCTFSRIRDAPSSESELPRSTIFGAAS